jgi:diguanylate cyclase (GGDEF)-like protein
VQAIKKVNSTRHKDYRTYLVINTIGYLGIGVHLALIPLFFLLGIEFLFIINIFSFLVWITAWRINKNGKHDLAIGLMICEVVLHTLLVVPIMGWNAGFQYYLIGAIPFSLFNTKLNGRLIILASIGLCLTFTSLDAFTHDTIQTLIHPAYIKIINYMNIMVAFAAIGIISYYFRLASMTLEHELELLAHTDSLTGLYNRRRMQELLDQQTAMFSRNRSKFTLIFGDIDYFKKFNDTYGHFCGDYVLSEAASFMKKNLRKGDVIARWGGEEFLIMLPDTDINGARIMAEKIRQAIANNHFHLAGGSFSVTMTFGLAQHEVGSSIEDTLKQADNSLYKGKEAGRNRVMG